MNYDCDQPTQSNQMKQPYHIEQNQAMHEEQMTDDDMEQESQLRRSTRSRQPL